MFAVAPEFVQQVGDAVAERLADSLAPPPVTPWMSLEEAAIYLRRSEDSLRSLVKRNRVPVHRVGGRLTFDREELDRWIREEA
jgi:excisionase family DNA binding protein